MRSAAGGVRRALPDLLPWPLRQAKLWAVSRSPSLVGLLYLPVPEDPVAIGRPRSAPTALRASDPELLECGETWVRGCTRSLVPPLPWHEEDPAIAQLLHEGEEVLALARAARGGHPGAIISAHLIVADWIARNPIPGGPGWHIQTVARRIACWSTALTEADTALGKLERRMWLSSLHLQARFLAANLPGDRLLALSALRALLGAGCVIAGAEARRWHASAARALIPAVAEAHGPDGVHGSRRPDVHLGVLAQLLDVLALAPPESRAARMARQAVPPMVRFAHAMAHPDGRPAGFGGRGHACSPERQQVLIASGRYDGTPPLSATFPEAGFSAFHPCDRDAVLVDWLGPGENTREPGAAGSYELSFAGECLVGTPAHESNPSSPGHSSASADGRPFHALTAAGVGLAGGRFGEGPGFDYLALEVARGGARLTRRMLVFESRALAVIDHIEGAQRTAQTAIQLMPGVRVCEAGRRSLYLEKNGVTATLAWMTGAELSGVEGAVAGPHGEPIAATRLLLSAPGGGPRMLAYVLAEGRRRDAEIDVLEHGPERIAIRYDPRRYFLSWENARPPRLLLAD